MKQNQKYYVSKNDVITIRCLACKKARRLSVASLKLKNHTLKVQCPCANTFVIDIEFRRSYRKKTDIAGRYRKKADPLAEGKSCIISDISLGGLSITITNETALEVEDELVVTFRLDDPHHSEIDAAVRVRHVDSREKIGGEFVELENNPVGEVISLFLQ